MPFTPSALNMRGEDDVEKIFICIFHDFLDYALPFLIFFIFVFGSFCFVVEEFCPDDSKKKKNNNNNEWTCVAWTWSEPAS